MRAIRRAGFIFFLFTPCAALADTDAVIACRGIEDPQARLTCFDRASADLVDQATTRQQQARRIFGFLTLPKIDTGGGKAESINLPERIDSIREKLSDVGYQSGRAVLYLESGQVWRVQEDGRVRFRGDGSDSVTIEKSFVGYTARVNDSSVELSVSRQR